MPPPGILRLAIFLGVSAEATLLAQTPPQNFRIFGPGHPSVEKPARPTADANGNPLRYAVTGHVSNYDEAKVGAYTLPDPLVLQNGQPVRDADTWFKERRPEIVRLYES